MKTGLLNDDYCHRALLLGPSPFLARLSEVGLKQDGSGCLSTALFDQFVAIDPARNLQELRAYGALPWWTCDDLRVSFWRPVASFTQWVDHRLFPGSLRLMHVHSILWFAATVFAVSLLYRRLTDAGWVAGLAALLYLLGDFSYFPTMWLANRNVLLSLFFGALALILHDRHRTQGGTFALVAAPACLLGSLLSAEAGVATLAYLFAYEVALREGRWTGRVLALMPFAVVTIGWRLAYNVLGYGAGGGGFYFDPVREPLRYTLAVLDRAPFFLGGQWTTVPPDLYSLFSGLSKQVLWGVLLLVAITIPALMLPLFRANRRARFWLVGMSLSALPVCATVPMSRALVFVAVGAFGLIAEFVGSWQQKARWVPTLGWHRTVMSVLIVTLLVAHLPWAAVRRVTIAQVTRRLERHVNKTMAISLLWWWRHEDLVLVNAPNPAAFLYDPFRNAYNGRSLPGGVRVLAPAFGALEVVRTQPHRLVIRAVAGSLLDCPDHGWPHFISFYRVLGDVRGSGRPMQVGQRIALPRMTVEVMQVDDRGLPVAAAFDFAVPLEDSSLQWIYWDWSFRDYAVFPIPGVGQTVTLAGPFP